MVAVRARTDRTDLGKTPSQVVDLTQLAGGDPHPGRMPGSTEVVGGDPGEEPMLGELLIRVKEELRTSVEGGAEEASNQEDLNQERRRH